MSDYPASWDPYQPPQAELVPVLPGKLPTGLKAICIIAIILGALGTLGSCGGIASLVVHESLSAEFGQFGLPLPPDKGPEAEQFQEKLQGEIAAIAEKYRPFTIVAVLLHLVAGLLLLVGGFLTLKLIRTGRLLLLLGCLVAILYELVQAVLSVVIQSQSMPMVGTALEGMLQRSGQGQMPQGVGQLMLVFMYVILGVSLVTVLVKIVFYAISLVYLNKPAIVARFAA
ncbi:MAG: hypothetical protein ACYC3X_03675 [Pirellulaceae bacterium]